eukprot:8002631-Karenia_brevis.AAC.1
MLQVRKLLSCLLTSMGQRHKFKWLQGKMRLLTVALMSVQALLAPSSCCFKLLAHHEIPMRRWHLQ